LVSRAVPFVPRVLTVHHGQLGDEPRALSDFALDPDLALMLFHDAVADRQAQAGPIARPFGREERVENPDENLQGNAGTAIGDSNANLVAALLGRHFDHAFAEMVI